MTNKLFLTFILSTFFVVNSFAQRVYDRIIMNDSTVENGIVKSIQMPVIQYNTYNIETQKEGAMHLISIADIARIEYANGRVVKAADLITNGVLQPPINTEHKVNKPVAPSIKNTPAKPPVNTNTPNYTPCFIVKTDLAGLAPGYINVGIEKSLTKSLTFEVYAGYARQNKDYALYLYEGGNYYDFNANLKSAGLFSMAAIKWYPGMSSRRSDYVFHTDGINAAPHGWNLALRERFVLTGTKSTITYTSITGNPQSSGGGFLLSGTTLDLGYQQSQVLKILNFEIFGGLGYLYRNSAAVNVVSPAGKTMEIIPRYNKIGLATSWGFTVGLDINAFKQNLK